jgi:hypothetical protein
MPSLGKSINLYLMDGSASGRWQATLSNWNGAAYKIPRGDLKDCGDLPELNAPGVYFLFGKDDEAGKLFIYVGEADDTQKRLLQPHTFEKDGSYWTEAVIFVTPDGTLEKGRVKYLENRFFTIATEAKRYIVKNGNTPSQSPMPKQIRDLLEEFIINAQLILPALGYMAFEPLPSSDKDDADVENELLYFSRNKGKGGSAIGRITSDGFWVLKSSYIYPQVADYTASGIKKARENYASSIDKNGILQEDICFGSPSYASTFVCGKNSNGLVEWKDKCGVSLKNLDSGDAEPSAPDKNKSAVKPQPVPVVSADAEILHLAGKKVAATGQISGDGFIVMKGSGFSPSETKSCQTWIKSLRAQLVADGKVKDCVFMEDIYFKSTSAAAACVTGGSANGNIMWLYSDGQSIKDKTVNI